MTIGFHEPRRGREMPSLGHEEWGPTQQTLHRYLQIVGKIRMSLVTPIPTGGTRRCT